MRLYTTQFATADDAWRQVVRTLADEEVIRSRAGDCREIVGAQLTINDACTFVGSRKFSAAYAAGELVWYLSGKASTEIIEHYAPSYSRFTRQALDGSRYAPGAYGPALLYIEDVVKELKASPDSRRAVVAPWNTQRDSVVDPSNPDKPCTLSLQFLRREGYSSGDLKEVGDRLHLIVTMRSNDTWLGMPYDMFCFMALQRLVARLLGVSPGRYIHQVGSLHLYEKDREKAVEAAKSGFAMGYIDEKEFKDYGVMTFADVSAAAVQLEKAVRTCRLNYEAAQHLVDCSPLAGTEIGSIVACCGLKNVAEASTRTPSHHVTSKL